MFCKIIIFSSKTFQRDYCGLQGCKACKVSGFVPPYHCCNCSSTCFPSEASLILENGKSVAMSQLQVGDKVETGKLNSTYFVQILIAEVTNGLRDVK